MAGLDIKFLIARRFNIDAEYTGFRYGRHFGETVMAPRSNRPGPEDRVLRRIANAPTHTTAVFLDVLREEAGPDVSKRFEQKLKSRE